MRSVLATAILFPTMLSAQALHTGVSHLVASVDAPAFAFQASAVKAALPAANTALIAPVRLTSLKLAPTAALIDASDITAEYTVDKAGVPQNIIVKGENLDAETTETIAKAVSKMRYTPGQLRGQTIEVPVSLHVEVK